MEDSEENEPTSAPGRENWRLHHKKYTVYREHSDRESLNDHNSLPISADSSGEAGQENITGTSKNILGILNSRGASGMLEQSEPFCYLWIVLSSLYGKLLIILMFAFTLIEVMDNSVKLLSLQGIYTMYLYVGSIVVILCIYIWVLIDSCSSLNKSSNPSFTTTIMSEAELGRLSLTRFGSLKKAHLTRDKTSSTSFYLRIGALAFGLGTLVFNGLEMAMHSMMEGHCLTDVVFVHPVLHGLFTFLQMHFLFVNSQVLVEKFGSVARFGFMHLAATNLALWTRLVIWESGIEWTYLIYLAQNSLQYSSPYSDVIPTPLHLQSYPKAIYYLRRQARDLAFRYNQTGTTINIFQPVSENHISQIVALHQCLNTNSLGQLWTSSMPFLYPFIVQFSLIAAGVTYVMGLNVGRDRLKHSMKLNKSNMNGKLCQTHNDRENQYRGSYIDCSGISKGLFLGLLCLVSAIVVIIIFLVVKDDETFPAETLFWLTTGTIACILLISLIMVIVGLVQIRKLSFIGKMPTLLDNILSTVSLAGVQLYTLFGIVIASSCIYIATPHSQDQRQYIMLLIVSSLQLIQSSVQSTLIAEGLRRGAITRYQNISTPARQVITFLLCSNTALWALDSFVTQSWISQELHLRFMGVLVWGVISRISLPLLVFYRFHSGILLLEIWQRAYSVKIEPLN